jgi:hypothetical protein
MRPAAQLGFAVAALVMGAASVSFAQVRTCVQIEATPAAADALGRLVKTEIDRHPTHRAAVADCDSYLTVEVIDLGAEGGKWVTGRIDTQVPHRERIGADGVAPAVERLLTIVLHNDPLVLHGPESPGWLRRQERALELRSVVHVGAEAYELMAPVGGTLVTLPGVALSVRREVSEFFIGLRVAGAFDPAAEPGRLHLRAQVDAQVEAAVYATPAAAWSLFASGLVGMVYQRFQGPAPLDGPGASGTATNTGLSLAARAGIEALRTTDLRLLAFLQLEAPAFVSTDPDHGVVHQWTPTATLGAGVLF